MALQRLARRMPCAISNESTGSFLVTTATGEPVRGRSRRLNRLTEDGGDRPATTSPVVGIEPLG